MFLGCGACQLTVPIPTCTADSECRTDGGNMICEVAPPTRCFCNTVKICQSNCASATCAAGQICDVDGRCKTKTCSAGDPCPTDFVCDSSGHCARKTCTMNTECSSDCVKGGCYSMPGTCQTAPG